MVRVDDSWPDYWKSVREETVAAGSSLEAYLAHDHDYVVAWFANHWELLERLTDDPVLDYLRFQGFDGDQLMYRFQVIGSSVGGVVRLIEFKVV